MRYRVALAAAFIVSLAGCDVLDFAGSQRFTADFHHSYPLKPGGRLSIDNQNGSIEVSGWDEQTVEIAGEKFANSEQLLEQIKIDISATPDSVTIRTIRPEVRRGSSGAKYVIKVPRQTRLDRVVSTNGHLRAQDIQADAELKTSNGAIRVYDLGGELAASTTNGSVEVTGVTGGAELKTTNGRIRAEEVRGSLEASTTNGSIAVELVKPEPNRPIRLSTTNGSVDARFSELNSNDLRASTTNGSITVRLPAGAGARVQARTNRSSVQSDFNVLSPAAREKHRLEGTIGAGGPLLDLSTSNGTIRLLKL
jgi:DUF4097 and DUF4098 domain-containing protein YvlB